MQVRSQRSWRVSVGTRRRQARYALSLSRIVLPSCLLQNDLHERFVHDLSAENVTGANVLAFSPKKKIEIYDTF